MKFFQGIQIVDEEKNIDCELLNLGRINILCGKNNAGKTTLLNIIANNNHSPLLRVKEIEELLTSTEIHSTSRTSNEKVELKKHIINAWREVESDYDKMFIELENIFELIGESLKTKGHIGLRVVEFIEFEEETLLSYDEYEMFVIEQRIKILSNITSIFLINAKRKIDCVLEHGLGRSSDKVSDILQYSGQNLIQFLYAAKNSSRKDVLSNVYDKIKYHFNQITKGYDFDIVIRTINDSARNTNKIVLEFGFAESYTDASDMGMGLQDVLTIITNVLQPYYNIILIEEPENHLNPEIQRELLRFLSQQTNKQFFISTHSSVFLDMSYVDKIYTVFYDDKINVRANTDKADALSELGYLSSDNLLSDIIILTEGKTDIPVLEEFLRTYNLFEEYDIKFLSLGGVSSLDRKYDSLIDNYSRIIIVTDGDNNRDSKKAIKGIKEKISEIDKITHCELEGYGIENYLNPVIIKTYYDEDSEYTLDEGFEECLNNDTLFKIEKKVKGFRKDEKLYRIIASRMTKEEIEKTHDIYENFIDKVREVCESLPKKK